MRDLIKKMPTQQHIASRIGTSRETVSRALSEFQRRGFGTLLLNHVEAAARARGFRTVILAVNKKNEKAIAVYRKHGLTIRESVITEIGGGFRMDDYIMVKLLPPQN